VRFWGLILDARQFNHKGKDLWGDHTSTDGVREAPCFQKYMGHWRFEQVRKLVGEGGHLLCGTGMEDVRKDGGRLQYK
jgi:hypothetical protein